MINTNTNIPTFQFATDQMPGPPIIKPITGNLEYGKWNWKKFWIALVDQIPYIGPAISAAMENKKAIPAGVSQEEAAQIDQWMNDVFIPFITKVSMNTGNALLRGITASDIPTINETLNYLCIIEGHFATNDQTTFLGDAALDFRYDLMMTSIETVRRSIAERMTASGLQYTLTSLNVSPSNYSLTPLITVPTAKSFRCSNYTPGKPQASNGVKTNTMSPATTLPSAAAATKQWYERPLVWLIAAGAAYALWPDKKQKSN